MALRFDKPKCSAIYFHRKPIQQYIRSYAVNAQEGSISQENQAYLIYGKQNGGS